jgi:hypothetical protein
MPDKVFLTANVFGKLIPTQTSIKAIWDEIQEEESMIAFFEASNTWAVTQNKLSNPKNYLNNCNASEVKALSLSLQRIEILRLQAKMSGFLNFDFFMQSEAVTSWHRAIRSNFTGGDAQGDRKRLNSIFKMGSAAKEFNSIELPPFEYIDKSLLEYRDSDDMLGYSLAQEYSLAVEYEMLSLEVLSNHFKMNEEMKKLTLKRWDVSKKLSKIAEQEKGTYLFQCVYCRKRSTVLQGKTPRSCGSKQCEDDYKENWEVINRPHIPKPRKQRKPNQPIDRAKGWVLGFGGKRRDCKWCGDKRQVDEDRSYCESCHLKEPPINS